MRSDTMAGCGSLAVAAWPAAASAALRAADKAAASAAALVRLCVPLPQRVRKDRGRAAPRSPASAVSMRAAAPVFCPVGLLCGAAAVDPSEGYRIYCPDKKRAKTADVTCTHRSRRNTKGWCTRRGMSEIVGKPNHILPAAPLGSAKLRMMRDQVHSGLGAGVELVPLNWDEWIHFNNEWCAAVYWWEAPLRNKR